MARAGGGFIWSTVLLYHGSFSINSLAHVHGKQKYVTGDDSRNNWWLSIITMGEGWHNNHHAYQSSTRQGFRWYEFDPTYYVLKVLSWVGVVWDLRTPPPEVVNNERRLGRRVIEQVAQQLADSFPVERMAAQVRAACGTRRRPRGAPGGRAVRRSRAGDAAPCGGCAEPGGWSPGAGGGGASLRGGAARVRASSRHPDLDEVRESVRKRFEHVPTVSVDDVARRAHRLLLEHVSLHLVEDPDPLRA
jgi:stearoyl-CoA desaturase (Delta-9 desaturase)